jgi:hypothetical protein
MFPPHFFGTFVAHKSLAYHTMNHDRLCNDFYYVSTFRKEDFLQKKQIVFLLKILKIVAEYILLFFPLSVCI